MKRQEVIAMRRKVDKVLHRLRGTDCGQRYGINEVGYKAIWVSELLRRGYVVRSEEAVGNVGYADLVLEKEDSVVYVECKYIRAPFVKRVTPHVPPPHEQSKEYREWIEKCIHELWHRYSKDPRFSVASLVVHSAMGVHHGWYEVATIVEKAQEQVRKYMLDETKKEKHGFVYGLVLVGVGPFQVVKMEKMEVKDGVHRERSVE